LFLACPTEIVPILINWLLQSRFFIRVSPILSHKSIYTTLKMKYQNSTLSVVKEQFTVRILDVGEQFATRWQLHLRLWWKSHPINCPSSGLECPADNATICQAVWVAKGSDWIVVTHMAPGCSQDGKDWLLHILRLRALFEPGPLSG